MDKETYNLDISVSNAEDIIDHFLSLAKKYVWGRLVFMVNTGTGANEIFRVVENIVLEDMHIKAFVYFGLQRIGNVN